LCINWACLLGIRRSRGIASSQPNKEALREKEELSAKLNKKEEEEERIRALEWPVEEEDGDGV